MYTSFWGWSIYWTLILVSKEVEDDSLSTSGPSGSSKRLKSSTLTDDTEEKDLERPRLGNC